MGRRASGASRGRTIRRVLTAALAFFFILALVSIGTFPIVPSAPAATAAAATGDRFGIAHVGDASNTDAWRFERAAQVGAGWNRWPLYWSSVERSVGQLDFGAYDALVSRDRAAGLSTNAILMNTPLFYATGSSRLAGADATISSGPDVADKSALFRYLRGRGDYRTQAIDPQTTAPRGLEQPIFCEPAACAATGTDTYRAGLIANPANPWGRFVFTAVSRYRDSVRHWEIWNEPDFRTFWNSSVADYARLLRVAYIAAKAADPNAFVLLGGMMYWEWANERGVEHAWLRAFLDTLDAGFPDRVGRGHYFDGIPWHMYSRSSDVYDVPRAAALLLASRGLSGKEQWVNESNAPACGESVNGLTTRCNDPDYRGSATLEEQASFVLQSHALGAAAGLARVFTFQFRDDGHREAFGLLRNDGSARPALTAYQVAAAYLGGASHATRATTSLVDRVSVWRQGTAPPTRVTVLWARTAVAAVASVDAIATTARLVDQDGAVQQIVASDGRFAVPLSPATNNRNFTGDPNDFTIGGRTRLLIEELPPDATPPTSRLVGLPATAFASVNVRWTADDHGGWGVESYRVWRRDATAGAGWSLWQGPTTATSAVLSGVPGHTHQIRVTARDQAGNEEAKPVDAVDGTVYFTAASHRTILPQVARLGALR